MLGGKAVVITGSGNGIGAACARGAAALGARIVVNDVDLRLENYYTYSKNYGYDYATNYGGGYGASKGEE